jgi:hypothetical protein
MVKKEKVFLDETEMLLMLEEINGKQDVQLKRKLERLDKGKQLEKERRLKRKENRREKRKSLQSVMDDLKKKKPKESITPGKVSKKRVSFETS